jgi:hypothetical protein
MTVKKIAVIGTGGTKRASVYGNSRSGSGIDSLFYNAKRAIYSAAVRISARSARTAQNLNSGIFPNGSSAGLVNRFAAASA